MEMHVEKVPLHILELDYIQSIILKHIYLRTDTLVFKGGTCLRKVHKINRFSEDLDFNILKGDPKETLEHGIKGLERTGIDAELSHFDDRKDVCLAKIRYSGPLYQGTSLSRGSIQIDISKHVVHREPEWRTTMENYPDVGTYSMKIMHPQEILAEKFRSLVQREMPRDLYDIFFILKKGARTRLDVINAKLSEVGAEPMDSHADAIECYTITDEQWSRDLRPLILRVPDLQSIRSEIMRMLEI